VFRAIGKSEMIFTKIKWKEKKFGQALHGCNRRRVTLTAFVGASGVASRPGLTYSADSKKVQSSGADVERQYVHAKVTTNNWLKDNAGLV
jgi:hypothetical protein